MKLALIDYGSGNIHSVSRAISHAATQAGISLSLQLTDDPDQIYQADRIVLPEVGHFADCYRSLTAIDGLVGALTEAVLGRAVPFLGICVGMQLLADYGREGGAQTASLGWIGGVVDVLWVPDMTLASIVCLQVFGVKRSTHGVQLLGAAWKLEIAMIFKSLQTRKLSRNKKSGCKQHRKL